MQFACIWDTIPHEVTHLMSFAAQDNLIDVQQLDFAYRDQLVLKHIDLRVTRGGSLGVIGPNGGGKTTLLMLMLGLIEPTRGRIVIEGTLSPRQAIRRGDVIGYVPQRPAQPHPSFPLNVRQLARLGLVGKTGMLRRHAAEDLAFVDELLARVGVAELADAPVGELSGGQLQRVLIARSLAPRPKVLLLDEPTTGIDAAGQQRFVESIAELKAALGLTVVIVSHDLRAVSAMCDRIACLNVTLHYHDVPSRVPPDVVYRMFACDVEALTAQASAHPTTEPVILSAAKDLPRADAGDPSLRPG
jgi:zinc transport system ATP-binding protein